MTLISSNCPDDKRRQPRGAAPHAFYRQTEKSWFHLPEDVKTIILEAGCGTRSCLHQHERAPLKCHRGQTWCQPDQKSFALQTKDQFHEQCAAMAVPWVMMRGPVLAQEHCKAPEHTQRNKIIPFQERGRLLCSEDFSGCGTCAITLCRGKSLYNKYVFNNGILVLTPGQAWLRAFLQPQLHQQQCLYVRSCTRTYHTEKNDCVLL